LVSGGTALKPNVGAWFAIEQVLNFGAHLRALARQG
jgi:hypothetical protein